jgi:hypothetical protein
LIASLDRAGAAAYQTSRSPGVRTVIACGLPGTGVPSWLALRITLTGVSSAHNVSSARSAAFIAASNPAASSLPASRSCARATNPTDTGAPSSDRISTAVRSAGTLPSLPSKTAAALTFGPYTTVPARPCGGSAQVTVPQLPQRRMGSSQCTFSSRTAGISHTCPQPRPAGSAPARPAPHDRHSAGGSACPVRSGSAAGRRPEP